MSLIFVQFICYANFQLLLDLFGLAEQDRISILQKKVEKTGEGTIRRWDKQENWRGVYSNWFERSRVS